MAVIISKQTAAVPASAETVFQVESGEVIALWADKLSGIEEVDIYYKGDPASEWVTLFDYSASSIVTLTATGHTIKLDVEGSYRVAKDATTLSSGVFTSQ